MAQPAAKPAKQKRDAEAHGAIRCTVCKTQFLSTQGLSTHIRRNIAKGDMRCRDAIRELSTPLWQEAEKSTGLKMLNLSGRP